MEWSARRATVPCGALSLVVARFVDARSIVLPNCNLAAMAPVASVARCTPAPEVDVMRSLRLARDLTRICGGFDEAWLVIEFLESLRLRRINGFNLIAF